MKSTKKRPTAGRNSARRARRVAIAMCAGLLGAGVSGCASGGASPGAASGASAGVGGGPASAGRGFYAEWYDASAVVLPPPPSAAAPAGRGP